MTWSSDAKDEVEDLHGFVEDMYEENRKWRAISFALGVLSVLLGALSVVVTFVLS